MSTHSNIICTYTHIDKDRSVFPILGSPSYLVQIVSIGAERAKREEWAFLNLNLILILILIQSPHSPLADIQAITWHSQHQHHHRFAASSFKFWLRYSYSYYNHNHNHCVLHLPSSSSLLVTYQKRKNIKGNYKKSNRGPRAQLRLPKIPQLTNQMWAKYYYYYYFLYEWATTHWYNTKSYLFDWAYWTYTQIKGQT